VDDQQPDLPEAVVQREEVSVMFKRVADDPAAISRGWGELEEALGSLRGRKFYGAFDAAIGEYRVCVEIRVGDVPDELGLELGRLPGGRYLRARLQGEPPNVYDLIAPTFESWRNVSTPIRASRHRVLPSERRDRLAAAGRLTPAAVSVELG
jgi:hypothetical protein